MKMDGLIYDKLKWGDRGICCDYNGVYCIWLYD